MYRSTAIANAYAALKSGMKHLSSPNADMRTLIEEVGAAIAFANAQPKPIDALASAAVAMTDYIASACEAGDEHPEVLALMKLAAGCSSAHGTAQFPSLNYGARCLDAELAQEMTASLERIIDSTPVYLSEHRMAAEALTELVSAFSQPSVKRNFGTGEGSELAHFIAGDGSNMAYERYCTLIAEDETAISELAIEMTLDRFAASTSQLAAAA